MTIAGTLEAVTTNLQGTLSQVEHALQSKGISANAAAHLRACINSTRAALASLHASLATQLREGIAGRCRAPTRLTVY